MAERFQSVWMALLLVSITMMLLQPQQGQAESKFEEEIKGKCQHFFTKENPPPQSVKTRCDTFWKTFTSAFVNKDPETVKQNDYNEMLKAEPIQIPADKLLLYSGNRQLLPLLNSQTTYVQVWHTLYGILDGKFWCGKKNSKEVFIEDCSFNPFDMYFAAVSAALARAASGSVIVLLNGDLGYMDDSFFAKYELPNLDFSSKGVTALRVLMVNKINADSCKEKANLIKLQEAMKEHRNLYHCRYIMETDFTKLPAVDWWNKAKS